MQSELLVCTSLVYAVSHNFTFKSLTRWVGGRRSKNIYHGLHLQGKKVHHFQWYVNHLFQVDFYLLCNSLSMDILVKTLMTEKDIKQRLI